MRLSATTPLVICSLLLAACAPQQPSVRPSPPPVVERYDVDKDAAAALASGDLEAAAALLEQRAQRAAAAEVPLLLLRAAEIRLDLGQAATARELLAQVSDPLLPSEGRYRKALLDVRLLLADGQIPAAEDALAALPPPVPELRPTWLKARSEVAAAAGEPLDAAQARIELDALLPDPQAQERNRRAIWTLLTEVPMEVLRARMPPPPDQLGAWLELAYLMRSHRLEPDNLQSVIQQWQQRYPDHPATAGLVAELLAHYQEAARGPAQIAVLLPLSGELSGPGKAILDGIMAGYYADGMQKPRIKVYDVGDASGTLAAYQEAVNAGSDFIVGPLTKESLIMLAGAGELSAPVLALNTLPGDDPPPSSMYQFALAPEDEAVAAADYAAEQGFGRALVMVPDGDWGDRTAAAFEQAFSRRGGAVLEVAPYDPQSTDFSDAITRLLNLDAGERRARQLRAVLKRDLKTEPQRRQDVDVIFVGAFPRAGRLIRPQLRFFDAIDVPVVATSHIYGGFPDPADRDLDGVDIVDMPWLLRDDSRDDGLGRSTLQQLREPAAQFPRLYAFGIDAYRLVRHLPLLRQYSAETMDGHTGVLSLDTRGRVHRRLYPARFRGAQARPLNEARAFGFELGDMITAPDGQAASHGDAAR